MLVGIVASPCHSAFTLPNALAPTFPLVGAFLFNIDKSGPSGRSAFHGSAGKDCELSRSTRVLEYWSVGKSEVLISP
jgi:hypothetical protein